LSSEIVFVVNRITSLLFKGRKPTLLKEWKAAVLDALRRGIGDTTGVEEQGMHSQG